MKNITDYEFKFNPVKWEFKNTNQSRKDLTEIYSIRIGQINKTICFVNLKSKKAIRCKVLTWSDGILKMIYNTKILTFNTNNEIIKPQIV